MIPFSEPEVLKSKLPPRLQVLLVVGTSTLQPASPIGQPVLGDPICSLGSVPETTASAKFITTLHNPSYGLQKESALKPKQGQNNSNLLQLYNRPTEPSATISPALNSLATQTSPTNYIPGLTRSTAPCIN